MGVDPCPNPTDIGNNNNSDSSGGGGNNDFNQNNSANSNDNNTCDVYVLETDWYTCVSVGNEVPDCHYSYTEYELVYENCGPDDNLPQIRRMMMHVQMMMIMFRLLSPRTLDTKFATSIQLLMKYLEMEVKPV